MWFVFLLCVIAAFADVIGGLLTVFKNLSQKEMMIIMGLGTGFLLGATLLDRLPDAIEKLPTLAPLFIMAGYLFLLFINQFGAYHDHGHDLKKPVEKISSNLITPKSAFISFIGLLLHTFMDGIIIAGAFAISRSTGFLIFFAVAMHKIPEGFSMATLSLASGSSRKRALLTSTALALSTLAGALLTLQIGGIHDKVVKILMAIATGTFLYVATTDMVPSIKSERGGILFVFIGIGIFYGSLLLIKHLGVD